MDIVERRVVVHEAAHQPGALQSLYINMLYVDLLYKNIYEPWFNKFVHETLPEVFAMCTHVQIKSRELFESSFGHDS